MIERDNLRERFAQYHNAHLSTIRALDSAVAEHRLAIAEQAFTTGDPEVLERIVVLGNEAWIVRKHTPQNYEWVPVPLGYVHPLGHAYV